MEVSRAAREVERWLRRRVWCFWRARYAWEEGDDDDGGCWWGKRVRRRGVVVVVAGVGAGGVEEVG